MNLISSKKSRVIWMREGDSNTTYFHRMVSAFQSINCIHYLVDVNGLWLESQQDIQSQCVDYFADLLGGEVSPLYVSLLNFGCSHEQITALEKPFSFQEIKDDFFSLPRNKTCGPDDFPTEFLTGCWSFVGVEVISAVNEFFRSGNMLKQWNTTTLVLIPKINNAV